MTGIVARRTLRHSSMYWLTSRECLLACFLSIISFSSAQRREFVEPNALNNPSITLQRMILDESQKMLYVGSVNSIFKLSEDLEIVLQERTGPVQDHPLCFPLPGPCTQGHERQLMDNVNKVLAIDGEKLITCGNVYQGTCQLRSLSNLAMLDNNTQEEVAPNSVHGTSIGFVANGPLGNVLYIASSQAPWIDGTVPTVSSRQIATDTRRDLFRVVEESQFSRGAKIIIPYESSTAATQFNISYVYRFPHGNFSYFVGIQPVDETKRSSPYTTKLARVCQRDFNYYSYIELPLKCVKDGVNYNLAQSAYVTTESILIVTFAKSNGKTLEPLEESAICMYSLKEIDLSFWSRRRACAAGETPSFEIKWQGTQNQGCFNSPHLVDAIDAIGPQYCHTQDFLYPLGGSTPIEATAIYTNYTLLTAIIETAYQNETVIFAGDNVGNVKKLRIVDNNTANFVEEESVSDRQDEPIAKNGLILNRRKNVVYAMLPTKIRTLSLKDFGKVFPTSTTPTLTDASLQPAGKVFPTSTTPTLTDASLQPAGNTTPSSSGLIGVYIGVPLLLAVFAVIGLYFYKYKLRKAHNDEGQSSLSYEHELPETVSRPVNPVDITWKDLCFLKELGSGQYGSVWLAETKLITSKGVVYKVAVKSTKEGAPASEKQNLLREWDLMKKFKPHPNVVQLLGGCYEKEQYCVILEYMERGSLDELLKNWHLNYPDYKNENACSEEQDTQLMMFATQVADGMEFIAANKCVHRDLAARNVLVSKDFICKVSDFGLARDGEEYHRVSEELKLPIRRMSVESLTSDVHTTKSDVWSFGVLFWEIITLGARPYPGMGTREVVHEVKEGYRMPKPEHCLEDLYDIMISCWAADPSDRPSFKEISQRIQRIIELKKNYLQLDMIDEGLYVTWEAIDEDEKV